MIKQFRGMGLIQQEKLTKRELAERKANLAVAVVRHKGIIPSIKLTDIKVFADVHALKIRKSKKAIFYTPYLCGNCKKAKLLKWKTQSKKAVLVCPRCHWTSEPAVKVERKKRKG